MLKDALKTNFACKNTLPSLRKCQYFYNIQLAGFKDLIMTVKFQPVKTLTNFYSKQEIVIRVCPQDLMGVFLGSGKTVKRHIMGFVSTFYLLDIYLIWAKLKFCRILSSFFHFRLDVQCFCWRSIFIHSFTFHQQ